ncbi:MAG: phage portal protein [Prevotella sp.]|nr:phage portal protein [Prevotella sp.]
MELFGTNIFGRHKREASLSPADQAKAGVPVTTDPNHPTNQQQKQQDGGGSFEERIVYAGHPRVALTVSAVYRAVELRAKTIGQMQMQYQMRNREGGNFVMDVQKPRGGNVSFGTRLNYLLQVEPNPMMSAQSMWEQVTVNRLMLGNGFIYIERDELDEPVHLWLAECGGYNLGTNTYTITYMGERGLIKNRIVPMSDVLHFPNTYRERNGFWGISTLKFAIDTLSLIKTEGQLALETAAKGGRVKGFISEEKPATGQGTLAFGMFNKDESERYAKEVNERVYQQDINVLRGLEKFQNLSLSAQDMQMIELLGISQDDVSRFFATPRPLLMMDTNSHYTTYTNATMEYLSRTIAPDGAEMEAECFRKFLSIYDYGQHRFHLCEQPLLRMDKETQAKVDMLNLQTGAKTINEVRAEHDMPAVENGDEPMASANLMTLKALIAKSDAAQQLKPGNYTVGEPPKEGEETA